MGGVENRSFSLSKDGAQVLFFILRNVPANSRPEARMNSRLTKAIKAKCFEYEDEKTESGRFIAGSMEVSEEVFRYATDLAGKVENKVLMTSANQPLLIPGSFSCGWVDLFEALDEAKKQS